MKASITLLAAFVLSCSAMGQAPTAADNIKRNAILDIPKPSTQEEAQTYYGITKAALIAKLGNPIQTLTGGNATDGEYTTLVYDTSKANYTEFTFWQNDKGITTDGEFRGLTIMAPDKWRKLRVARAMQAAGYNQ